MNQETVCVTSRYSVSTNVDALVTKASEYDFKDRRRKGRSKPWADKHCGATKK